MKKLLTALILILFFSCNFQNKIIGDWTAYEDGELMGDVTFNPDNTLILKAEYRDREIEMNWDGSDTNLCLENIVDEEMICGSLNWVSNDIFHFTDEDGYSTTFKRKN